MDEDRMNIIGISSHFHDSACCLLRDGMLCAAAEEERFTRIKHDPGIPRHAFQFCLKEGGLTVNEIDAIAYYEDPKKKLARQLWMALPDFPSASENALHRLDPTRAERDIREGLGFAGQIRFVEHHLSHAASAYFFSGFDEAALFTVDAVGEWTTTSFGYAQGAKLALTEEIDFPHSLGLFYSAMTAYLGFEVNEGEYKVMGLAPYGQARFVKQVQSLFEETSKGALRLRLRYFDFLSGTEMFSAALCELFGRPPRRPESALDPFWCDVAKSTQVVLEELLLEKLRYLYSVTPCANLCMSGGVALNCVANGRIHREGPYRNIFIQPAPGDSGACLGAAAYVHALATESRPAKSRLAHTFWGPGYHDHEILAMFSASELSPIDFTHSEAALVNAIAERLSNGKIVGWFQGRMEFGPRALGGRSILADPRPEWMRERINSVVKQRESFRPFAPSILEEDVSDYFCTRNSHPFMLETVEVKKNASLQATTHSDNSARVQTVSQRDHPRFYALLEAFKAQTGCPVLLNTSFNVRGEPIVCSPLDALLCFIRSGMDTLVLESYVIDREMLPSPWVDWFLGTSPRKIAGVQHTVYTLL
jgi:carbamoyltransferase